MCDLMETTLCQFSELSYWLVTWKQVYVIWNYQTQHDVWIMFKWLCELETHDDQCLHAGSVKHQSYIWYEIWLCNDVQMMIIMSNVDQMVMWSGNKYDIQMIIITSMQAVSSILLQVCKEKQCNESCQNFISTVIYESMYNVHCTWQK